EKYSYLLKIPQETHPVKDESSEQIIPLLSDKQQYDLVDIKVNGVQANMRLKSEYGNIQSEDKQGKFILAGQPRRSHFYEIDLELVLPVSDSDKDGLPDFWEKQYGLNISDPEDASTDIDNDGWTNLNEFFYATNPIISNKSPVLLESDILTFEGSKSLLQLNIADSDTPKDELSIKFISIPSGIQLIFHGDNTPFSNGHILQKNDMIKLIHLENGNIIIENKVTETITQRLDIELIDADHAPVISHITISTFKPTASDGTDAILWADSFYHAQKEGDTPSKRIQERSGNENRGNYYTYSEADESYAESDIQLIEKGSPSGNSVIAMNGYFELPYATPVFPEGNSTIFSVFKVNPGDNDHIVAAGPYFEIAVAGNNNPLHPGELKVADESTAVYSNKRIDDDWIMATVTRKGEGTFIDINSIWSGGPFAYNETNELANDPTMGGKNIWKWDFTNLEWMANVSGVMNGLFAEMLVFDRPLPYLEKWRIYAHLYGKWFGYVISDHSQATRDMKIVSISGQQSETIRLLRTEADIAWMAYSDAIFANENVLQALAQLEAILPSKWQWNEVPPSVDEALNAIDIFKYNYQKDFVLPYGKDKSYLLMGGMGNDTIIGGYENDILIGGPGANTLQGCSGRDIFVVTDGDDVIDFNVFDDDIIDISHLLNNTDKSLNNYIHFELVNDPETGEVHTMLKINADGTGDQFNDADILLRNVTLRDRIDIAGLWASGNIHAGGSRPELEVALSIMDDQATEIPEKNASFEISFSNVTLPENLTIPLSLNGTAKIGLDYQLEFPVWDENSNVY
ncbi:Type 1 secretion, target domain protein, partial [Candidatus Magnetomorum sp. HK-1]